MTDAPPRNHEADLYRADLRSFIEAAWPIVEKRKALEWNWHLDELINVLQLVQDGAIDRVIINVPPGTMKSKLITIMWPAWLWASDPTLRFLCVSYQEKLSGRHSGEVHEIVTSEWYQSLFPGTQILKGSDNKTRYELTAGGWRQSSSMLGGGATGEHPDILIVDDAHDASATQLGDMKKMFNQRDAYDSTLSTRGGPLGAPHVIVGQRLHETDLPGHLLAQGGWHHIRFPMEFEVEHADPLDQRTEEGELLWPALWSNERIRKTEIALGPYSASGQFQQRPSPKGGGMFKMEWFDTVGAVPAGARSMRGWDTAATEGAGDYTAGVKISTYQGLFFIEDVVRGQWSPFDVDKMMKSTAMTDGKACAIREEREGGSGGKRQTAQHARLLVGYDYREVIVSTSKQARVLGAGGFRAQCEAGNVKLVRGAWNSAYLAELCVFPAGAHDDQVDASSCAFNELVAGPGKITSRRVKWG